MATTDTTSVVIEFLDLLQSTTTSFDMPMPFDLTDAEYPLQIVELQPPQEILWADLAHGGDTELSVDHSPVIACWGNMDQMRLGLRFSLHGTWCSLCTNCKHYIRGWWGMSGRWRLAGARWICPTWHAILWWLRIHNRHLWISSPQCNRRMTPPTASFLPLRPPALVCHLLVWPVQYIVYTWKWERASECLIYNCISCGPH